MFSFASYESEKINPFSESYSLIGPKCIGVSRSRKRIFKIKNSLEANVYFKMNDNDFLTLLSSLESYVCKKINPFLTNTGG